MSKTPTACTATIPRACRPVCCHLSILIFTIRRILGARSARGIQAEHLKCNDHAEKGPWPSVKLMKRPEDEGIQGKHNQHRLLPLFEKIVEIFHAVISNH
jgi:hypothetical protein